MFKVEGNYLIWDNSRYLIPKELHSMKSKIAYGTATKGLASRRAIFLRARSGKSVEVAIESKNASGFLIDDDIPESGELVYIREQMEPNGKRFWLISAKEIDTEMNWVNVLYRDGTLLRICPFSKQYWIEN